MAKVKPGGLPLVLDDGSIDDRPWNDSMAEAIETALNDLLQAAGLGRLPTDNNPETRDRRMFMLAIARGVVAHLKGRAGAFDLSSTGEHEHIFFGTSGTHAHAVTDIETE